MYGSNIELPNRILSYKEAHNKWASTKPIRGRSEDIRPLARRSNDNLTIRQEDCSGDIIIRLYNTDIIRYRSYGDGYNNLIEIKPYASVLTNRVMNSILAPHVFTHWSDRGASMALDHITEVNGRYYSTPEFVAVQPKETGWELVAGAKPLDVPYVNRKEAKQALKETGFNEFRVWLETMIRLGSDPRSGWWRRMPYSRSPSEVVKYLTAGEKGWRELAERMSRVGNLEQQFSKLRLAVYTYEYCCDAKTVEYFTSHQEMRNAINQIKKFY